MRFSSLHKATTYLTIISSVFSLLFSPDIPKITTLLVLIAIAASWFFEPSRITIPRWSAIWNMVTLGMLAYLALEVWTGESVIVAGMHFLLFVLINKLFNRQSSKDYQQTHVVSFLILVATTTLNTSLSYAVCFIFYVIFSVWSLSLLHLRREVEENYLLKHSEGAQSQRVDVERILNSRRVVGKAFLATTSLVSLGILLGTALLFFLFPRVGFGFFGQIRQSGIAMVGFSERVQLGHHGTVRDNPAVVMRVSTKKRQGSIRWRGSAFDHYKNGIWSHSDLFFGVTETVPTVDGIYHMNPAYGLPDRRGNEFIRNELTRQEIYLEPIDSNILFGADRPVALEVPKIGLRKPFYPRRGPMGEMRTTRRRISAVRYIGYSQLKKPSPKFLKKATLLKDPRLALYLQMPTKLRKKISKLANQITESHKTVYEKVEAVKKHLIQNYTYTTKLTHNPRYEPVYEFLFVTRRGHCEYFASAMTLLLRASGIHARNVNGFAGGEWNDYGQFYVIRHGHAHAWTEVLFSNTGWVTYDPTPSASLRGGLRATGFMATIGQFVDAIRLRWFDYVVQYDLQKQLSMAKKLKKVFRSDPLGNTTTGLAKYRPHFIIGIVTIALIIGIWFAVRKKKKWKRRGWIRSKERTTTHPATKIYREALNLLAKAGKSKRPAVTPMEFAAQLQKEKFKGAELFQEITRSYYVARFNDDPEVSKNHQIDGEKLLESIKRFQQLLSEQIEPAK